MTFNLEALLKNLPRKPGVYRMMDAKEQVIYVGKAKDLKNRVSSYFRKNVDSAKTQLLVSKIVSVQLTITNTDNEALILENNLIKELKPRYNILLRDDKSYPYIVLSKHNQYPRLSAYRGVKRKQQSYFGPFPNAGAVKETLYSLQKLFKIRSCTDSYFNHRSRPCLQHQIERCSAPCVNLISPSDYEQDITKATLFLKGKNKELIHRLQEQMRIESEELHFETAARLRDQISKLEHIQQQQHVMRDKGNFDVVVIMQQLEQIGLVLFNVNDGKLLGNKSYYPKTKKIALPEVLYAFLTQHYLAADSIPPQILINIEPDDKQWLDSALSEYSGHKVETMVPARGEKTHWIELAKNNLNEALMAYIQENLTQKKRWQVLQQTLSLKQPIERMECFDISHSQGEATVASCAVFNADGPVKSDYRRFNIKNIVPGDDYAALHQAITRRYSRMVKEQKKLPELIVIDGGKGQFKQAEKVFSDLNIDSVDLMSISKGPGRNPDYDILWLSSVAKAIHLPSNSIALHLVQQIRDEAHRFAITGHKLQRGKKRQHSILEDIEGVGAKRRRDLLKAFGGLQEVQKASVQQIAAVSGIGKALADKIHQHIH